MWKENFILMQRFRFFRFPVFQRAFCSAGNALPFRFRRKSTYFCYEIKIFWSLMCFFVNILYFCPSVSMKAVFGNRCSDVWIRVRFLGATCSREAPTPPSRGAFPLGIFPGPSSEKKPVMEPRMIRMIRMKTKGAVIMSTTESAKMQRLFMFLPRKRCF